MSLAVRRYIVGTREEFERAKDRFDATMIVGADVYWGRDGTLLLTVPQSWADYFHNRTSEIPDDDALNGSQPFEFDEAEFRELFKQ